MDLPLLIDCDGCAVRGSGCADCVVTALLGNAADTAFDADSLQALDVLADVGLVAPLRLLSVETTARDDHAAAGGAPTTRRRRAAG